MIRQEIEYLDFNSNKQKAVAYFNLNDIEALRLEAMFVGGLEKAVANLDPINKPDEVLELFETVMRMSYGEKTEDGKHFVKKGEDGSLLFDRFEQSAAYSALVVYFIRNTDKSSQFFNNLMASNAIPEKTPQVVSNN